MKEKEQWHSADSRHLLRVTHGAAVLQHYKMIGSWLQDATVLLLHVYFL